MQTCNHESSQCIKWEISTCTIPRFQAHISTPGFFNFMNLLMLIGENCINDFRIRTLIFYLMCNCYGSKGCQYPFLCYCLWYIYTSCIVLFRFMPFCFHCGLSWNFNMMGCMISGFSGREFKNHNNCKYQSI